MLVNIKVLFISTAFFLEMSVQASCLFLIEFWGFLLLILVCLLYILDAAPLSGMWIKNICSLAEACLSQAKAFNFDEV